MRQRCCPLAGDYFRLRRPLDRRLYDLARKHCGAKEKWRIGIDKLVKRNAAPKQEHANPLCAICVETAEADHLPDYALTRWMTIRLCSSSERGTRQA